MLGVMTMMCCVFLLVSLWMRVYMDEVMVSGFVGLSRSMVFAGITFLPFALNRCESSLDSLVVCLMGVVGVLFMRPILTFCE